MLPRASRIWPRSSFGSSLLKAFVLDDERLKNPDHPFDYFEESPPSHPGHPNLGTPFLSKITGYLRHQY